MTRASVGILGIGVYLPEHIRTNDDWPEPIVDGWQHDKEKRRASAAAMAREGPTEGARATGRAVLELIDDPFLGSKQRRIMGEHEVASDMEVRASRDLIDRTGVNVDDIQVLLSAAVIPESLPNRAGFIHEQLGLPRKCLSLQVDAACNSFMVQLSLARALLAAGSCRYVLATQSCTLAHLIPDQDPVSAWFSDGATAVLLGSVEEPYGLLAEEHFTDGSNHDCLTISTPGGRLHDDGPLRFYSPNPAAAKEMLYAIADRGADALTQACTRAAISPAELDFYACHQATAWMRPVTQAIVGAHRARSIDHFAFAASLSACNVPFQLALAEREGLLHAGDLCGLYAGGVGETWSGMVLRWGGA